VVATSIRLEADIEKRLDTLVRKTGRSKAFYLRHMIESGIEDIEDYYLAADVLERLRIGQEETSPLEAVVKSLGLDD
jgi:RHH-type rel operon transcriptional repressor/antitoxin RelB